MIQNKVQYRVASEQLAKFAISLVELEASNNPTWIEKAQIDAIKSVMQNLSDQITEYKNQTNSGSE